ncbi:AAA family ATPase [Comamonadaceae bacterium G21597-S1]|nr:AAA family ATPase [Comamonadaceae bacterium G21597-S1]
MMQPCLEDHAMVRAGDLKRRLAAILAGDAVAYSRLMAQDEHATVAALDVARSLFREQIDANHGRVIDMAGDSVLAVFETATGAVTAALAIQQAINAGALERAPNARMVFRIGLHLGEVIEKADGTVYGDGVNVAARLQTLAPAGGITVSDVLHGLVHGRVDADYVDLGAQHLKNIARPVQVYAITVEGVVPLPEPVQRAASAAATTTAMAPSHTRPTPDADTDAATTSAKTARAATLFIGRRQELAGLTTALATARGGNGQVVVLAGSGGIGKTRLAQQLAAQAEADGVPVLWGRCLEEPGAPPYWPWRQLIRSYLRNSGDTDPARTFGSALVDIAGIVPELADHIAVPSPDTDTLDNAQSRFRLFDAVVGFLRRAAQRAPLLLVFEDLHWADATSLRLLAFLASELDDCALLVLGTYRDTELSRAHPLVDTLAELARSPAFGRIALGGLSGAETEAFMSATIGHTADAHLASALHARTEGHPLFLEETLRLIVDGGMPAPDAPAASFPLAPLQVPTGVREAIGKRLNRLSATTARLLSKAACIGRRFDTDILTRLESERSEDEVLQALEEAVGSHLIEPVPESHDFRFSHALIRETLYDEMLALRGSRLHLRIGELLEAQHGQADGQVLPQLAYHFGAAGTAAAAVKALDYATRSAEQARQVLAFEEAGNQYRLALQVQHKHLAADAALRCRLLLQLGDVELSAGSGLAARDVFALAGTLARSGGHTEWFARAAIGFERASMLAAQSGEAAVALLSEALALHQHADGLRVELLARLCRACVYSDRASEAVAAHTQAVALARTLGEPQGLFVALASIVSANYWPRMLAQRLEAAREAWRIVEAVRHKVPFIDLVPYYLADLEHAGDIATLRQVLDLSMHLAEQSRSPYLMALCRHTEALLAINEGRFAQAETWAIEALHSGRRITRDQAASAYGMQMFCLRREQGRLGEALPVLRHFVQSTPEAQQWPPGLALLYAELDMRAECQAQFDNLPWHTAMRPARDASTLTIIFFAAEICVYLHDVARAATLYPLLAEHAGSNLMPDFGGPCLGSADRLLGNLAAVQQQWEQAQAHFEAALEMDQHTGARVWLAHSRYDYARMLHRRGHEGDAARARELLEPALADSTALGMQALTPRIAALVQEVEAPRSANPCGLTEREVEVLRLIAMGRNNREIGKVLAISPNTVANHVRNILEKTYTANRTEAAAFANREGLLGS